MAFEKNMSNGRVLKVWVICKTTFQKMISLSDATLVFNILFP